MRSPERGLVAPELEAPQTIPIGGKMEGKNLGACFKLHPFPAIIGTWNSCCMIKIT